MNRFSVTFLDKKARLYTCNREVYTAGLSESRFTLNNPFRRLFREAAQKK